MRDWVRQLYVVNRSPFNSQMRDIHRRGGIVAQLRAHCDNKFYRSAGGRERDNKWRTSRSRFTPRWRNMMHYQAVPWLVNFYCRRIFEHGGFQRQYYIRDDIYLVIVSCSSLECAVTHVIIGCVGNFTSS